MTAETMAERPQVIVADRQLIVCQGIGSLVSQIPEVRLGPFATDKAGLKQLLSKTEGPAILILGVRLSDGDLTSVLDTVRKILSAGDDRGRGRGYRVRLHPHGDQVGRQLGLHDGPDPDQPAAHPRQAGRGAFHRPHRYPAQA